MTAPTTTTAPAGLEYKRVPLAFKQAGASPMAFEAIISTPHVDAVGDVVLPSAFTPGQSVPLIVAHNWDALPVGRGVVMPTATDTRLSGTFFDTAAGREAYQTAKALGGLAEFSIGFHTIAEHFEQRDDRRVRVVDKLELFEASIVLKGAAVGTGLVDIKGDRGWRGVEDTLRRLSRDDDETTSPRALARLGFDRTGNVITHKGMVMFEAAALAPPDDDDDGAALVFKAMVRTALDPDYRQAFSRVLALACKHMRVAPALALLTPAERRALEAGTDAQGGYLVPLDIGAAMLARAAASSVVRPRARVVPTGRDMLTLPAFAANADPAYSSGFTGSWDAEVPLFHDDSPALAAVTVPVRKLRVAAKISRDLAADAGGTDWLLAEGARNIAAAEDRAFIIGDGLGQPLGILNGGVATVDIEGTTANTISNTTGDAGSAPKLLDLAGALPSQYQRGAVLVAASATETAINKLVDAQGRYLWPRVDHDGDGLRELLGYPVACSPFVPEGGTAGSVVIIGDLSAYVIAARSLLSLVLTERFAEYDQLGVIIIDRIGGALWNVDAMRLGTV